MTIPEFDLRERCLAEARRLLKDLRSEVPERVVAAAQRFLRLRSLADCPAEQLPPRARRKHALAVVAEEHGHASWRALVSAAAAVPPPFHAPSLGGFLNRWFADAEEARASRDAEGGYVLPFRSQCFVCEAQFVIELGLDPDDPDWLAVGFDLVRPANTAARDRLYAKRRAALRLGIAVPAVARSRRR